MCETQQVQPASRKHRHKPQHLLLPSSSRDPLGTGERQQQAGTWHPVPAGHLPACAASLESPGPHLHPAWFLPGCSALVQLHSLLPARQEDLGKRHPEQLPHQSCASRLPQPLSCHLHLILGSCPREKQLTPVSCGNGSFNTCTSLPWVTRVPHCPSRVKAEKLRVSVAGTHRGPRLPLAQGWDKWCPHTVRRKHCFIA